MRVVFVFVIICAIIVSVIAPLMLNSTSERKGLTLGQSFSLTKYVDTGFGQPALVEICSTPPNVGLLFQLQSSNGTIISNHKVMETPFRMDIKANTDNYTLIIKNIGNQTTTIDPILTQEDPHYDALTGEMDTLVRHPNVNNDLQYNI